MKQKACHVVEQNTIQQRPTVYLRVGHELRGQLDTAQVELTVGIAAAFQQRRVQSHRVGVKLHHGGEVADTHAYPPLHHRFGSAYEPHGGSCL